MREQYGVAAALIKGLGAFLMLMILGANGPAAAEPVHILAFGDSLTAGYGLPPEQGFAPRLEGALRAQGYNVTVANGGESGRTTSGGKAALNWVLKAQPRTPDLVILELGANDMLRGVDPATTRANLEAMIATLKDAGIPVLLAGMRAAPNWGADYVDAFDSIFPELADKHDLPLYPFFLDGVVLRPRLLLDDLLHPNAKGVDVIVNRILPTVEETLTSLGVAPNAETVRRD